MRNHDMARNKSDHTCGNDGTSPANKHRRCRLGSMARKAVVALFLASLFMLVSIAGLCAYIYYHPEKIKPLIAKTISGYTDTRCSIQELTYSLNPMSVRAKGITISPSGGTPGLSLHISQFAVDLGLEGSFGQRSLIVKNFAIRDFSITFNGEAVLPGLEKKTGEHGLVSRTMARITALLLYRDVRLRGADIEGGEAQVRIGEYMVRAYDILGTWTPDQRLETSFSLYGDSVKKGVSLWIPSAKINIEPNLSLEELQIKGSVESETGFFHLPDFRVGRLRLAIPLQYHHGTKTIQTTGAEIELHEVETPYFSVADGPLEVRIQTDAVFDTNRNRFSARTFQIQLADFIWINGSLSSDLGPEPALNLTSLHGRLHPRQIISGLGVDLKKHMPPLNLSGQVEIRGQIALNRLNGTWVVTPDIEIQFQDNAFSLQTEEMNLDGILTGSLQAREPFPRPNVAVRLQASNMRIAGKDVELGPSGVTLSFSGQHPLYRLSIFSLDAPHAAIDAGKKRFRVEDIRVRAAGGVFDGARRSFDLPEIHFNTSAIGNLVLSLKGPLERMMFRIRGSDTRLSKAADVFGLLPTDLHCEARDHLEITGVLALPRITYESQIDLRELQFQNREGTCLGEKIDIALTSKGEWNLHHSRLQAGARIDIHGGEILLDRFYLNLSENPFTTRIDGADCRFSDGALSFSGLQIGLKNIVEINASGRLRLKPGITGLHVQLNLPEIPLKPVYEHLIREPYKTESPFLEKLNLAGRVSTRVTVEGDRDGLIIKGRCVLEDGSLFLTGNDLSLEGINFELPVWYSDLSRNGIPSDLLHGLLSIRSITHPMLPEQSIDIPVEARPNRLRFEGPIPLKTPGGAVQMDSIDLYDMFTPDMTVRSGIQINDAKVQPFLSQFWPHPVEGTIQGRISPILFQHEQIRTEGNVIVNFFEGEVVISNIEVHNLFSSIPLFKLDAMWQDLNLAKMTAGTAFGKVDGMLKGHVTNLEIANGQPQRFELLLETEKKEGADQRISIKAVENIAQIGGGQSPFMGLAGTFASLFKTFPYEKIGARASLENDVFRINGLIHEDGLEYIVKRGGFSGVNVVNQNPDNRIRFKDMVKRIKRITASKTAPVIE